MDRKIVFIAGFVEAEKQYASYTRKTSYASICCIVAIVLLLLLRSNVVLMSKSMLYINASVSFLQAKRANRDHKDHQGQPVNGVSFYDWC